VLAYVSAAGDDMPPLMIFYRVNPEYKLGTDENTTFAQQKLGWVNGDIYKRPSVRPLLLVFDKLKVHISLWLI